MRFQQSGLIHNRREELSDKDRYFIDSSQDIAVQDIDQSRVHPDKVRVSHCPSVEFPPGWEIGDLGILDETERDNLLPLTTKEEQARREGLF